MVFTWCDLRQVTTCWPSVTSWPQEQLITSCICSLHRGMLMKSIPSPLNHGAKHINLVGGLEHEFYVSIYWESYSHLTNIFQDGWNHQPVNYQYTLTLHPLTVSTLDAPSQLLWALNCWSSFWSFRLWDFRGSIPSFSLDYPQTESYINITRSSLVLQKTLWKGVQGNHKPALK